MMTVHRFIGRYVLNTSSARRRLGLVLAVLLCGSAHAAPASRIDSAADALAVAEGAWADTLLQARSQDEQTWGSYDEQIFTELSPLIDSPEAVKLPEDQLLTD